MRSLVCGLGEVGSALFDVLGGEKSDVWGLDLNQEAEGKFDVLHVCIPYSDRFEVFVTSYQQKYLLPGGLTVIHSTVPVGTSERLEAVHSPIRGVHPNLVEGIRTFVKFFGGPRAEEAAAQFRSLGIECEVTESSRDTEAAKLFCTTSYGWNIILEKLIHKWCEEHGVSFDLVYKRFGETYNTGYKALGRSEVCRPVLNHMEGPIGGHCVIPNCRLLGGVIADFILNQNDLWFSPTQARRPDSTKIVSS